MKEVGAVAYLAVLSIWDIKSRKIPIRYLIAGGMVAGVCLLGTCMGEGMVLGEGVGRMLPGMIMLVLAYMTHQVGKGDGYLLLMAGCVFPYRTCMVIFLGSLLLTALAAGGLLAAGKAKRQTRLPYVPFMCVSTLLVGIMTWGG